VAANEQLECLIVAVRDESFEQFGIPDLGAFALAGDLAEVADDTLKLTGRHGIPPGP
jgi:hypothetical protein